jgi:hypothetical protein
MSLRKSHQLTPELLAATRNNAQHSTGPRSAAAKQNSKLNALKHGAYVRDENQHQAMMALGQDPPAEGISRPADHSSWSGRWHEDGEHRESP